MWRLQTGSFCWFFCVLLDTGWLSFSGRCFLVQYIFFVLSSSLNKDKKKFFEQSLLFQFARNCAAYIWTRSTAQPCGLNKELHIILWFENPELQLKQAGVENWKIEVTWFDSDCRGHDSKLTQSVSGLLLLLTYFLFPQEMFLPLTYDKCIYHSTDVTLQRTMTIYWVFELLLTKMIEWISSSASGSTLPTKTPGSFSFMSLGPQCYNSMRYFNFLFYFFFKENKQTLLSWTFTKFPATRTAAQSTQFPQHCSWSSCTWTIKTHMPEWCSTTSSLIS